ARPGGGGPPAPPPPPPPRGGGRGQASRQSSGLPSRSPGSGTSSSFRIVGARSMMWGEVVETFRLLKKTPPLISAAVAQWSPLHFRLLFSTTERLTPPMV